ncbi:MAG: hypothetical protein B9S32_17790 [Verrucomicrobia bacterium Tous-C9LFEB]|nr:MAG: hypothetical protein B9S32_17790 [Verrucomicrobia bacterium Tous-C9LFEB]
MRIFFEQIHYANWTDWCPFAAFAISFAVFLAWLWWAFHLSAESLDRMANLPLSESPEGTVVTDSSTTSVSHAKE